MIHWIQNRIKTKVLGLPPETPIESIGRIQYARAFRAWKVMTLRHLRDIALIAIGVLSAAFGLEGFLLPNHFIDGGATGIALLVSQISGWSLPLILIIINIPFIILGYRISGTAFAIKTASAIIGLSLAVTFIHFPQVTEDKLLVAVFGGFFLGAGIGIAVRGGSVLDGTEVLALFISRRTGATLGDIIMVLNIVIFGIAAKLLSLEAALYSIITYLAAYKTVDFLIEGIEEYLGVTIISPHYLAIHEVLRNQLRRGVTVYRGRRGVGHYEHTQEVDILYTVITRLEINRLHTEIKKIDPNAFVVMTPVRDTRGGMIKKRPLHHD